MTLLALLLPLLLVPKAAEPIAPAELDSGRFEGAERYIETRTEGIAPGVAIGIVQDGEIVYERYAGYADLEHEVKVSPDTRFDIASNAKQFTALCVLELAREGLLDLDEDIRTYVPELYEDSPHLITVTHLIDHTSGLRDVHSLWGLQGKTWWKHVLDNGDAIELLARQRDLNFEPGTEYGYSNSNYLVLTEIVKRVTGRPFHEYAASLFERAGMHQTVFFSDSMGIVPDRAAPYGDWNGWKRYPTITSLHGDGALFTTLRDQLAWEIVVQTRQAPDLDADLIATSQEPIPGSRIDTYGFGLDLTDYKGIECVAHEGSSGAYHATFLRFPSERLAVVAMSNSGRISTFALARAYADELLGEDKLVEPTYPVRPKTLGPKPREADIVGVYEMDDESIAKITNRRGTITLEIGQQDAVRLAHDRGNMYRRAKARSEKLSFSVDGEQGSTLTIYRRGQTPVVGKRLTAGPMGPDYPRSIEGRYLNAETDTEIVLRHRADDEYDVVKNGKSRVGTLLVRDRMRAHFRTLRIDRDEEGRIRGLLVDGSRAQNVAFAKVSE